MCFQVKKKQTNKHENNTKISSATFGGSALEHPTPFASIYFFLRYDPAKNVIGRELQ